MVHWVWCPTTKDDASCKTSSIKILYQGGEDGGPSVNLSGVGHDPQICSVTCTVSLKTRLASFCEHFLIFQDVS
jgi:hypothetical protein